LDFKKTVEDKITPIITAKGYELYKLQIIPQKKSCLVRVFIDHNEGITIDDCVEITRLLNDYFFIENLFDGEYRLEVSSPGINRPLETAKDFERNKGRLIRFQVQDKNLDKIKMMQGRLVAIDKEILTLEKEKGEIQELKISSIKKARVEPEFK